MSLLFASSFYSHLFKLVYKYAMFVFPHLIKCFEISRSHGNCSRVSIVGWRRDWWLSLYVSPPPPHQSKYRSIKMEKKVYSTQIFTLRKEFQTNALVSWFVQVGILRLLLIKPATGWYESEKSKQTTKQTENQINTRDPRPHNTARVSDFFLGGGALTIFARSVVFYACLSSRSVGLQYMQVTMVTN